MSNKQNKLIKELISKLEKDGVDVSKYEQDLDNINKNLKDKKYGLIWEQHTEPLIEELKSKVVELQEVKERRIFKGEEYTNNFLIEGDNLESLNALLKSGLEGKIDIIAIDPPYNTGNKDFVYNDSYVDKENSFRHSKWLSFMEKRLRLAKELLTEDGAIFIHIDDNEQANLKLLCDSIYGEDNYIESLIVRANNKGRHTNFFLKSHEYVLVYRKSDKLTHLEGVKRTVNEINDKYNKKDSEGNKYQSIEWRKRGANSKREDSPNCYYPVYAYKDGSISVEYDEGKELHTEIYPKLSDGSDGRWRGTRDTFKDRVGRMYVHKKRNGGYNINERVYPKSKEDRKGLNTILDDSRYSTESGSLNLKSVKGGRKFDYPKSLDLIKTMIDLRYGEDLTILDFFSGSGTTGHAVLEYNKENGTNHNFILCTNNENNICEDVTYQRINKVINGYTTPKGKEVEGINANLTYLKTNLIDKEEDYIMYESNHLEYIINLLKLKYGITDELELNNSGYIENVIIKLPTETQDIYIYLNDYIDEEDFNKVELNKEKESIIYVDESLVNDKNLLLKGFKNVNSVNKYFK